MNSFKQLELAGTLIDDAMSYLYSVSETEEEFAKNFEGFKLALLSILEIMNNGEA